MSETEVLLTVFGETPEPEDPADKYWVPEYQRKDSDDDDPDGTSNALDDETGDDLDGWKPGDPE